METVICHCGSSLCRGRINATDWQRSDLQSRYGMHWMSYLCEKIAVHGQAMARLTQEATEASYETSSNDSPRFPSAPLGGPEPFKGYRALWCAADSNDGVLHDDGS